MLDSLPFGILLLLTLVAFIAGIVDSITGGGGLITMPALLATGLNPIAALGTIKLQAAACEFSAALHFSKAVNYGKITVYIVYTAAGAVVGTLILQIIKIEWVNTLIPWLLLFALICFLIPKKPNTDHPHQFHRLKVMAPLIGFYNGFFGPGTGSLWSVGLMKIIHLSPKEAVIYTKPLNFIGNIVAFVVFLFSGQIYWAAAISMSAGSFLGGKIGAHLVTAKKLPFIKWGICAVLLISTVSAFYKESLLATIG